MRIAAKIWAMTAMHSRNATVLPRLRSKELSQRHEAIVGVWFVTNRCRSDGTYVLAIEVQTIWFGVLPGRASRPGRGGGHQYRRATVRIARREATCPLAAKDVATGALVAQIQFPWILTL